jgi:hypothetical protein
MFIINLKYTQQDKKILLYQITTILIPIKSEKIFYRYENQKTNIKNKRKNLLHMNDIYFLMILY